MDYQCTSRGNGDRDSLYVAMYQVYKHMQLKTSRAIIFSIDPYTEVKVASNGGSFLDSYDMSSGCF